MNCLDRHVAKDPSAVAVIWEKNTPGEQEEITYKYVCCNSAVENILNVDYTICHPSHVVFLPHVTSQRTS